MSTSASRLALLCALVGLGASIAAAYVHYHLIFDPTYTSFCDINTSVSCTEVYLSQYSTFRGIPVSIFGAIWFAAAALLTVTGMVAGGNVRESVPGYLFAASTLALAVVLYFEYVSFVVLKAYCVLCLTMAAGVVGLFFLSGSTTPFPMTTLPRRALVISRARVQSAGAIGDSAVSRQGGVHAHMRETGRDRCDGNRRRPGHGWGRGAGSTPTRRRCEVRAVGGTGEGSIAIPPK